jgi:putative NADH-flavin reductase
MNITLFGATGETGQLLIEKTLAVGHNVTVFARTPSKISVKNERLTVVKGELTELSNIEKAVQGADAVISILGPTRETKGLVIADGIKNIISAMEKNGVKRLIATATPSYKDSNDKFQFSFAFAVFMIKTMMKDSYQNIVETGNLIAKSNLDWTIVRLPMLSNKLTTHKLNIGYVGDGKVNLFSLSRADLADFLLQQTEDKTYLHKSPLISN